MTRLIVPISSLLFLFLLCSCERTESEVAVSADSALERPGDETGGEGDEYVYLADKYGRIIAREHRDSVAAREGRTAELPEYGLIEDAYRSQVLTMSRGDTTSLVHPHAVVFSGGWFNAGGVDRIFIYKTASDSLDVELYRDMGSGPKLVQSIRGLPVMGEVDARFMDFTGDRVGDLVVYAGHAARPSNYFLNLLVVDRNRRKFVHIPAFAELPQVRYREETNTILAVYKHGLYHAIEFAWVDCYTLGEVAGESIITTDELWFREKYRIDASGGKHIYRIDTLSADLVSTDCFGCGPEAWDYYFENREEEGVSDDVHGL